MEGSGWKPVPTFPNWTMEGATTETTELVSARIRICIAPASQVHNAGMTIPTPRLAADLRGLPYDRPLLCKLSLGSNTAAVNR
jgi:hypothetical protein